MKKQNNRTEQTIAGISQEEKKKLNIVPGDLLEDVISRRGETQTLLDFADFSEDEAKFGAIECGCMLCSAREQWLADRLRTLAKVYDEMGNHPCFE